MIQLAQWLLYVVNGLKVHLLPKFKPMPNPIPISIPEGDFLSIQIASVYFQVTTMKQDNQNLVIPVVNNSIAHVIKSSRNVCSVNGISSTISETEQLQAEYSNRQHNHTLIYQSPGWSDARSLIYVRTTLETMPQEESQLDWRATSRILQ
ncbi:hypothetical protein ACTFIW_003368 [Dictyostelium discoideum]